MKKLVIAAIMTLALSVSSYAKEKPKCKKSYHVIKCKGVAGAKRDFFCSKNKKPKTAKKQRFCKREKTNKKP